MIFGGGCASGTLTDSGEGEARAWIVTLFFCIGGILGTNREPWWSESVFSKVGTTVYLPMYWVYRSSYNFFNSIILTIYIN